MVAVLRKLSANHSPFTIHLMYNYGSHTLYITISIRYTYSHTQFVVWSSVQINTKDCIALVFELFGTLYYVKYGKWMFRSCDGKCQQNCKPYTNGFIRINNKRPHLLSPLSMRIWSQFNKINCCTQSIERWAPRHWLWEMKNLFALTRQCPHWLVRIICIFHTEYMFYHRWKFHRILQMNEWKLLYIFMRYSLYPKLVATGKRVRLCMYVKQKNSFRKTNFILSSY